MKHCEFEYEGKKCPSKEVVGMARCKNLCRTHFQTVMNDNRRRFNKGMEIPKELIFTRELRSAETWSKVRNQLNNGGKNGN